MGGRRPRYVPTKLNPGAALLVAEYAGRVFTSQELEMATQDTVVGARWHPDIAMGPPAEAVDDFERVARIGAVLSGRMFATPDVLVAAAADTLPHKLEVRAGACPRGGNRCQELTQLTRAIVTTVAARAFEVTAQQ